MADEVELKLEIANEDAATFEASGLLANSAKKVRQISTYFDTPEHDVANAGFSLRIRRSGKKRVQTIKADGASAAGLFMRSEWERAAENGSPVLDDTTPLRALLGDKADSIAPAFEVEIDRQTWNIDEGGAAIELVLDRGEVVAGQRRSQVCEIELELKSGDPAALFAFARRIAAVVPVRLGVLSKAERGYALAGAAPTRMMAEPVVLACDATAAQAFGQIVQSCIRQFRLNESLLLASRDAGALHQARVALRRLRSAFSIFTPMIGDAGAELRAELRWLASELGQARDLDVLLKRAEPGPLYDRIAAMREATYDAVCEILASARARRLPFDVTEWAATADWSGKAGGSHDGNAPARDFATKALDRFRRKVKREGRYLADIDDEARHEARKSAKKMRYATEFFQGLFEHKTEKRRHKRFVKALEALQDQLGALNDLATAPDVLKRLGVAEAPGAANLLAHGKKGKLLDAAVDAHEDFIDTKRFW
ncbi:ceramide glucosyltransferase [Sphingopyxis fribergensis]|uniref:Ceramide glucosyltransferase n=1 Tax=Sphingopyxis fribergensis TaxID=1515612 RepID=A0A0A7PGE4_9SPHN|nr:CHAD domain-containing protein [Sphingopyxis fribergensis]AJA09049.1 ceramide glucosyltransferase [Sphingopyxis fribergensis]